jgi:prephenate dehydratase
MNTKEYRISKLLYLGPAGSFSHICALEIVNFFEQTAKDAHSSEIKPLIKLEDFQLLDFPSINSVREGIEESSNNEKIFGLLPVENSLGGSVPETLDGLIKGSQSVEVRLEWVMHVEHCLVGFGNINDIKEIRAHYQAFAQCDDFLKKSFSNNFEKKEMTSNSAAALSLLDMKSDNNNKQIAAICSKEAAEMYKIPIIQKGINDSQNNYTRFWLISKSPLRVEQSEKTNTLTSLAFRIPQNVPGGLMRVLDCLVKRNINLSKIESRPTKGKLCEYTFFIDFVNPANWSEIQEEVCEEVKNICSNFYFLGNYSVLPAGDFRFT